MTMPRRVRAAQYWLRTRIDPVRGLLSSDKAVARQLAHAHWGPDTVSMNRDTLARRTGLSTRTVQRAIGRLVTAGLLQVVERGRICAGRRLRQVYRLVKPQVDPRGDTLSPPSTSPGQQALPLHPLTDDFPHIGHLFRTTTRQPLRGAPPTA